MASISLDGSAFDSTQLSCLQEIVDDGFWRCVSPSVKQVFELSKAEFPSYKCDVDQLHKNF
jgi:hypothetical protein